MRARVPIAQPSERLSPKSSAVTEMPALPTTITGTRPQRSDTQPHGTAEVARPTMIAEASQPA